MNNSQVAHTWAGQRKDTAHGSSFYFEGPVIYSYGYHFPIARFTNKRDANGEEIVLFTTAGYSSTTAKHKTHVRRALHGLPVRVLYVTHPDADYNPANVRDLLADRALKITLASRAVNRGPALIAEAEALAETIADYCLAYGEPVPDIAGVTPALLESAKAKAKANSIAKKQANAKRAEREKAEAKKRAEESADKLRQWRAGLVGASALPYSYSGLTALRLSADRQTIETSRGASVPVSVAPGLWRVSCDALAAGKDVDYNKGREYDVNGWALREACADGSLIIGCHTIPRAELELIAQALGYIA